MSTQMENLESKFAFLDAEVAGLRDAVDIQQQQILALESQCQTLRMRLADALAGGDENAGNDDTPPPHY